MKKLFTIDDFAVAFISALGYGFGETIAKLLGWPELLCVVASFALGIALEELISKICFSETVQSRPATRVATYVLILLIFVIAQCISVRWMGVSMLDYLEEEFAFVIGLPILGFVVNLLIRGYRVRKIRKRYGDGSEGYVFDVKQEDIEEVNQANQAVHGDYDADCTVKTQTGIYVGEKYKKAVCYLGIPYAQPPVGERRWKAPEPLPASEAVYEAKNFGASAIQVEHKSSIVRQHRQSEDCLTLNIGVGAEKTDAKKPVLVLFHPGDFTYGGSVDPLLYGGEFANSHPDVVFVTFNYRLGIFGFIDFSRVPGGEGYPDAMNLGLLDQIAALKWIRENISAFGGDPERVTVLGFEAGATSICLLAAGDRAKGLFQRAFIFNGSPALAYDTPEGAGALARDLLKETKTSTMEELMRLDTEMLKDAAQRLWLDMCAPTCDGAWIPADVYQAFKDGAASGIEFVIGIPSNITQVYKSFVGDENYADAVLSAAADLQREMDKPAAEALQAYMAEQTANSTELEAKSQLVNEWLALCLYRTAASLSEGGNQVHLMYWDEKPLIENLGSGTVDAVATMLGNSDALEMYGSVLNEDLSESLQALLLKFVKGDPLQLYPNEIRGLDALEWQAFPQALIVSDGMLTCDTIEDRLAKIEGLSDFAVKR